MTIVTGKYSKVTLFVCLLPGIGDYPEGQYVSQTISVHRLTDCQPDMDPMVMSEDDCGDLLLWLSSHSLTFKDLKKVLQGESAQRLENTQ